MKQEDVGERVRQFREIRDMIEKTKNRHKQELEELLSVRDYLSGMIQSFLDANNISSLNTVHGTAYKSIKAVATIADPEAFMSFIREGEHWNMLKKAANPAAVREYVDEHHTVPAGVNFALVQTLGINRPRKPTKSKKDTNETEVELNETEE